MKNEITKDASATKQVVALLNTAFEKGISVFLDQGQLKLKAAKDQQLDPELIAQLREQKAAIIEFLQEENKQVDVEERRGILAFDRRATQDIPLSFDQQRLWLVDKMTGSTHYHIPIVLRLKGRLEREALEAIFRIIVDRHEVLRTVFYEKDGIPYQRVMPAGAWQLQYEEMEGLKAAKAIEEYIAQRLRQPFDLSKDHMLRAQLLRLSKTEHLLVMVMHHIAADGWSTPIFIKELIALYQAGRAARATLLPPLPIQYADYAHWQRNYLRGAVLEEKMAYWERQLEGLPPLELPTDFARPTLQSTRGQSLEVQLDGDLYAALQQLARARGVTLYTLLLAAFKVLLYRYTGQEDLAVGTPIANRTQPEVEGLIGFFVNTLCLRSRVEGSQPFTMMLEQLQQTVMDAYDHQEVPFEKIVDRLVQHRDTSRSPLFQVVFLLQNDKDLPSLQLEGMSFSAETPNYTVAKYDLIFKVIETTKGLHFLVTYCSDLFAEKSIERLLQHYRLLLQSIVLDPRAPLSELSILSDQERTLLLNQLAGYAEEYESKNALDCFSEQVQQRPQKVAVAGETPWTYQQLDRYSNQLANILIARGVEAKDFVGVCMDRSPEFIGALLAVLKTGAAYVPIDPKIPEARVQHMVKDTELKWVITKTLYSAPFQGVQELAILDCVAEATAINSAAIEQPEVELHMEQLMYIIYTSGSTGEPKGAMITHRSLSNLVQWHIKTYNTNEACRSLFMSTISFDAMCWEIWPYLSTGGTLCIPNEEERMLAKALVQFCVRNEVTDTFLPTALVPAFVNYSRGVDMAMKVAATGGDALPPIDITDLSYRLFNNYGPTETTVISTSYELQPRDKDRMPPIGKPIANEYIYLLDQHLQLVPLGVKGELYLAGAGLGKGYWRRPELNAEKFVEVSLDGSTPVRLYRTGDLARWDADGNLDFLGRIDNQVQIRGYRIELGEVENALLQSPLVRQAVVRTTQQGGSHQQLIGYVVPEGAWDKEVVQQQLRAQLPEYMIPTLLITLPEFPLNTNGKIDRKNLPLPNVEDLQAKHFVAPRNKSESQLADIWKTLLKLEQVGVHDNFFELGGHSLLAARLLSVVQEQIGVELSVKDIFQMPTVAELSAFLIAQGQLKALPAIEASQRPERIPLSFAQERLWFIDQLEGSQHYHISTVLELKGEVDQGFLTTAFQTMVNRHEILRTVYREDDGQRWQEILPRDQWQLIFSAAEGSAAESFLQACVTQPFDLQQDHMLRAQLIQLSEVHHQLVIVLHHIAADGWSIPIFIKELLALYQAYHNGENPLLSPLSIQYADYAIWQRDYLQGAVLAEHMHYWREQLADLAPLDLLTDYPRPAIQSLRGATHRFGLDPTLSRQLELLAQREGVSRYMLLLAAFNVLLYRYSGQADICVGSPVANRNQPEAEGLVGMFVNMLALRSQLEGNPGFSSFLSQLKTTSLEAIQHQELPFEKIVDQIVKERDLSRSPLFQVVFSWQNETERQAIELEGLSIEPLPFAEMSTKFDLLLAMSAGAEGLSGTLEYCQDLFQPATIKRLQNHFVQLLRSIVANPQCGIAELSLLNPLEEEQLLEEFNARTGSYPADQSIPALFEAQVRRNIEQQAIVFEDRRLSYHELDTQANQLAHYLIEKGVAPGDRVACLLERSPALIVSLLAILKAGATYVSIDPRYPEERVNFMKSDSAASYFLDEKMLNTEASTIAQYSSQAPAVSIHPYDAAYVIYTSGTSGQPKGVIVSHQNVVSLVKNNCFINLEPSDVLLSTGSPSFDATTFEYWGMLLNGGKLLLCPETSLLDPPLLKSLIQKEKCSLMWFTAGWFNELVEADISLFAGLRSVIVGGEKLSAYHVRKLRKAYSALQIINGYGPTENSTFSLTYEIGEEVQENIPIGKPLNNRSAYILDQHGQLCPIGVAGELYVGGAGLAIGYLNAEALNAQRFLPNPFQPDQRFYRTGDLARWLPDGNVEFLGRIDNQLKIRGYRIEPSEIEIILQQSPMIRQAVVMARGERSDNRQLIAYVVAEKEYVQEQVVQQLRTQLPHYMIPALLIELAELPLTTSGKVDYQALPEPDWTTLTEKSYRAPRSITEKQLTAIWQELLSVDKIGIHDHFFELGGHSLLATRVLSAIRSRMQLEVSIRELFEYPTVAGLAVILDSREKNTMLQAIRSQPRPERVPLSFSQARLWFIDKLGGSSHYHIPSVLEIKGPLDQTILNRSINAIVNRHEVLRSIYVEQDGEAGQQLLPKDSWQLTFFPQGHFETEEQMEAWLSRELTSPFNLSADHMIRLHLIERAEEDYLLVFVLHHIASDGWSSSVLMKEFIAFYTAFVENKEAVVPALPLQYADYALWQRARENDGLLQEQLDWWVGQLEEVEPLKLPTDFPRPTIQSTRGDQLRISIDRVKTDRLLQLAQANNATLFMVVMGLIKVLLHRYSGQNDICVGTPIANRRYQDLEPLIGFFANTLALRSDLSDQPSFLQLLEQIRTNTLAAYANQDVPFEQIVDRVVKERDLSRTPLFQVLLILQNTPDTPIFDLAELELNPLPHQSDTAKFDLTMGVMETPEGLKIKIVYCTDLFRHETIARMMQHFELLLDSVLAAPETPIGSLRLLSSKEEAQLLAFNDTKAPYPAEQSITELFEEQARLHPTAPAITEADFLLNYQALNERANRLAHYLIRHAKLNENPFVAICMPRSLDLIVSALAILKAGGAYVPVDPKYPQDRIDYMCSESNDFVITAPKLQEIQAQLADLPSSNPALNLAPSTAAYAIYTSGTTGVPKGVIVTHQNVVSLVRGGDYLPLHSEEILLSTCSPSFDVSTFEYWGMLLNGAQIVICPEHILLDMELLKDMIRKYRATMMWSTTGWFNQLIDTDLAIFEGLQTVMSGGEQLSARHVRRLRERYPALTIMNGYGPTENSTYSTTFLFGDHIEERISIGKPCSNRQAYVLDQNRQLCPVGVVGDLWVGGAGIAAGYLNNPELTAERFIDSPFGAESRLYRTGDLSRWYADGNIEFLGRMDDQVKVRGYRIELGEIESALNESTMVQRGIVLARPDSKGVRRLEAFVVPEGPFDKEALKAYLQTQLPTYMVPSIWVPIASLPLTTNGKVNKRALVVPEHMALPEEHFQSPRTAEEQQLAAIWRELLELEQVGIYDNFFELGGNSIKIIKLLHHLKELYGDRIKVSDLFDYPSIGQLTAHLATEQPKAEGQKKLRKLSL
ncbi:MAG: amino acid adenylation domain-containing protein [Bacteroidota bacterium]